MLVPLSLFFCFLVFGFVFIFCCGGGGGFSMVCVLFGGFCFVLFWVLFWFLFVFLLLFCVSHNMLLHSGHGA